MINGCIESNKGKSTFRQKYQNSRASCGTRTHDEPARKSQKNYKNQLRIDCALVRSCFMFVAFGASSRWTTRPVKLVREEEIVAVYIVTFRGFLLH